tara:strand:- start:94 stop:1986 length:1893 start_codon:yes stop_codon:yes gene_type:complete
MAGAIIEVKYFNTFLLKKTVDNGKNVLWNGSFGIPESIGGYPATGANEEADSWVIEESRIRGGYNNTSVDFGAKAYIVEEEPQGTRRFNAIIYSGIFNSRTGINRTNVFSVAEDITKAADPANGSIQKLYAEDTNLNVFQELKVSRALIDKDAIYAAEGGGTVTASNLVIGVIQPYSGKFGISKNPESFAAYGFRKYFSDVNNNSILRLSRDGLTEISNYGMKDFFRDELNTVTTSQSNGKIIGAYDIYGKDYVISMQNGENFKTLNFDEKPTGWVSFFSYAPDQAFSLRNKFYTVKSIGGNASVNGAVTASPNVTVDGVQNFIEQYSTVELLVQGIPDYTAVPLGTTVVSFNSATGVLVLSGNVTLANNDFLTFGGVAKLWQHYDTSVNRGNFYGQDNRTSVTFVFNPIPTSSKTFNTIGYEGSNGWGVDQYTSDPTGTQFVENWQNTIDSTSSIKSYTEGEYIITEGSGTAAAASTTITVFLNLSSVTGTIRAGDSVSGIGVQLNTTVISYNAGSGLLTLNATLNTAIGALLSFSGSVVRANYLSVFGTLNPPNQKNYAGFVLKENKYVSNLLNNSIAAPGEIIFGSAISGIKGFFTTVKMSTDATTDLGGEKTLFSVESVYTMNNGY